MKFHRTVIGGAEIDADVRGTLDREADKLRVTFYVDKHLESDEKEHLHFADDAPSLDAAVAKQLREFAAAKSVNIYVHKPDYSDESFPNAIDMGPSSKR